MLRGPWCLSDFNEIWILSTDFSITSCFKIQRISSQWEPNCTLRTCEHDEVDGLQSRFCEPAVCWKLILLPASFSRMRTSLLCSQDWVNLCLCNGGVVYLRERCWTNVNGPRVWSYAGLLRCRLLSWSFVRWWNFLKGWICVDRPGSLLRSCFMVSSHSCCCILYMTTSLVSPV
jgi:hypothetical protein